MSMDKIDTPINDKATRKDCPVCNTAATAVSGSVIQETPVECLLSQGHSLDELVELFTDKNEQHDLYVSSALVYPDFKTITAALVYFKEHHY